MNFDDAPSRGACFLLDSTTFEASLSPETLRFVVEGVFLVVLQLVPEIVDMLPTDLPFLAQFSQVAEQLVGTVSWYPKSKG